ncbi:MAG TPA: DUF3144 domain-containing protein [Cellvibrionaceae bacterium]|nr:DUF3144 domain-containing protein [Cellvibrionaceae bacterium]HMW46782.1 DUF3144 domain-containing protein [Cellvibrionaceae bacterium]HMW70929.1 DUF3144 domain-containing protein [Cellvibrionaceae bacterium]HMY38889.1 DUF3144 domain-containing protein [Marinagarivorans sp.]HNG58932.1 DUF3144 domain-containing protein [Cellvibrionaceae bacterium]
MTDNAELENRYWDLVDQLIGQANEACEHLDPSAVSAALLNAAARFNAFAVATASLDRNEFSEEIEPALQHLTGRYRELLRDNLEDYREHYKVYIRPNEA